MPLCIVHFDMIRTCTVYYNHIPVVADKHFYRGFSRICIHLLCSSMFRGFCFLCVWLLQKQHQLICSDTKSSLTCVLEILSVPQY